MSLMNILEDFDWLDTFTDEANRLLVGGKFPHINISVKDKDFLIRAELPGVDEFISEQISIPVGWWLTDEDLTTIVNAVVEYDHSCCATIQEISNPSS